MTTSKVTIAADQVGNVIGISSNPEYGYVRVVQQINKISEGGWLNIVTRSALIKGKLEDLKATGYKAGDTIPGNIMVKESFEPFNPKNPDKDLKVAGSTGVVCRLDDQPIYRTTYYTANPYAEDEEIMHNNQDEIREAQAAQRAINTLVQNREPVTL